MDLISNALTQIRNTIAVNKASCLVRHSKMIEELLRIMKEEKYIADFKVEEKGAQKSIRVFPAYDHEGKPVINSLKRVSKPGRRLYSSVEKLPRVLGGIGILIISTSKGLMTGRKAKEQLLGGEIVCEIY